MMCGMVKIGKKCAEFDSLVYCGFWLTAYYFVLLCVNLVKNSLYFKTMKSTQITPLYNSSMNYLRCISSDFSWEFITCPIKISYECNKWRNAWNACHAMMSIIMTLCHYSIGWFFHTLNNFQWIWFFMNTCC